MRFPFFRREKTPAPREDGAALPAPGELDIAVIDGGVRLVRCRSKAPSLALPAQIDGLPLAEIGEDAFNTCQTLHAIAIPEGVRRIGPHAFISCRHLETISLPEGLEEIGDGAFAGCARLAALRLPDSVARIGSLAVSYCDALTSLTLPRGLTSLGVMAISQCKRLHTVIIADGVQEIGLWSFFECPALRCVRVPHSAVSIAMDAFSGCPQMILRGAAGSRAQAFTHAKGLLFQTETADSRLQEDGDAFEYAVLSLRDGSGEAVRFVRYLGAQARFAVPAAVQGSAVLEIGALAFARCAALEEVAVPEGVTHISAGAFLECRDLRRVTLPASVTEIHDAAFALCGPLALCAPEGSAAGAFAAAHGIRFEATR